MTTCEHNTSTVHADHGNVELSECDWGCGAILISIERDGITRTLTADEAWKLAEAVNLFICPCGWSGRNPIQAGNVELCPDCEDVLEATE